jgi:uncharacterized protein YwgA
VATPREWLLLLFERSAAPIDRIRIQKAMFLFSQRSKAGEEEKYTFQPYNYGPFSFEIYPDLDLLVAEGFLNQQRVEWMSSPLYSLTTRGAEAARETMSRVSETRLAFLHGLREYVQNHSFTSLLKEIYRLYPSYATRSAFRS